MVECSSVLSIRSCSETELAQSPAEALRVGVRLSRGSWQDVSPPIAVLDVTRCLSSRAVRECRSPSWMSLGIALSRRPPGEARASPIMIWGGLASAPVEIPADAKKP